MPRVSVIIPTYNNGRYLAGALQSVFTQTYTDYEVVVVDDGSTDDTKEVVEPFEKQVRYLYQANSGIASARNLGISWASGEFIAYLDADDIWYPNKLEKQVGFLDAHPEFGLVHSDVSIIDEHGRMLHFSFNRETKRSVPRGRCLWELLDDCHIQILTVVERREWLDRVGGFDETLRTCEDYFHWIMASKSGASFGYIDEPLAKYRRWGGGISSSERRMHRGVIKILEKLLQDGSLANQYGRAAVDKVVDRLYTLNLDLAYLERVEGRIADARRRLLQIIWTRPLHFGPYRELFKSCVPQKVASAIRSLRERRGRESLLVGNPIRASRATAQPTARPLGGRLSDDSKQNAPRQP